MRGRRGMRREGGGEGEEEEEEEEEEAVIVRNIFTVYFKTQNNYICICRNLYLYTTYITLKLG